MSNRGRGEPEHRGEPPERDEILAALDGLPRAAPLVAALPVPRRTVFRSASEATPIGLETAVEIRDGSRGEVDGPDLVVSHEDDLAVVG